MAPRKKRRARTTPRTDAAASRRTATMPFDPANYRLLGGAVLLILVGYGLMLLDNATNDNPVDSAVSLVVAPLLLLAGYLGVAGAVLHGAPGLRRDAAEADDSA